MSRDLGDFQTPNELVRLIYEALVKTYGSSWQRLLEPTCGKGNFIQEGMKSLQALDDIVGIEIQDSYVDVARRISVGGKRPRIVQASVFDFGSDLQIPWEGDGPLLVVGNPPWVTNSELGALGSDNLPRKSNFKRVKGLDALTGSANFDIAEYIWLTLLYNLLADDATIALLCKTSVARNVLRYAHGEKWPIGDAAIWRIGSQRWFGASADACLFALRTSITPPSFKVAVHDDLSSNFPSSIMGFDGQRLIPDIESFAAVRHLVRKGQMVWRQGLKHDAAPVMELSRTDAGWTNGLKETVEVEAEYVFPLLKGSDIANRRLDPIEKAVLIPQRAIGEDTRKLTSIAPRLWNYLTSHEEVFGKRRSSIYKGKAPYSVFGVGPYTFAQHKVVVSGLHKKGHFAYVGPYDDRPVVVDDTCYMLEVGSAEEGLLFEFALNHPLVKQVLDSLTFWDAKRPITKGLLSQIDLFLILGHIPKIELQQEGFDGELIDEVMNRLGDEALAQEQLVPTI